MVKVEIASNDAGQRLDRFLKKYLRKAPLSAIYKIIRKDLKLNGKRAKEDTILTDGDELSLYISDERLNELTASKERHRAKRQFKIAYEDENVLIVEKPKGLLTHGDSHEKKNTLTNQVCGYLQDNGEYQPAREKTFKPSPVNRLDRNTTGLVIFGKTAESLRQLTEVIRKREYVTKYYVTIVAGKLDETLIIENFLKKNSQTNTVAVSDAGQYAKSVVKPLEISKNGKFSLVEVELVTGRTHQIRVHLSSCGHPLIGDNKYGIKHTSATTQFLHAYRLVFGEICDEYSILKGLMGLEVKSEIPNDFKAVWEKIKR